MTSIRSDLDQVLVTERELWLDGPPYEVFKRLRDFVLPYIEIRNRKKGYAVSIVKAGMGAVGRAAGPVRTPLTDLDQDEMNALSRLVAGRS